MESDASSSRQSTLILQQELSESTCSKQSTLILQQDAQELSDSGESISGFSTVSSVNIEKTICDKLHGVFFHMEYNDKQTVVKFFVAAPFESFIKQLMLAFVGQGDTSKDIIRLTTHVQKKNVYLEIDKTSKQLKVSGPGQHLWRENQFSRLSINLYRTLMTDQTWEEIEPLSPLTSTPSWDAHNAETVF